MTEVNLMLGDCLEVMKELPDNSVDMVLADIPYGEVNQKSSGLRKLDREKADVCNIDLNEAVAQCIRVCTGSFYIFCGVGQISTLDSCFRGRKMTTRLCQ